MSAVARRWPLVAMLTVLVAGCAHQAADWGYGSSDGPAAWAALAPEFAACRDGRTQSPVDLASANPTPGPTLTLDYHATPIRILNTGRTVQFDYQPGSSLTLDGTVYQLKQFHFHAPGEHLSGDRRYPLEMHLVHQAADGRRAVVAVWFDVGAFNPSLGAGWSALPHGAGHRRSLPGEVDVGKLLPTAGAYYRYHGSLTAPPCSEGIEWVVFRATSELSAAQLTAFTSIYQMNARPLQPLNERTIQLITP